MSPHVLHFTENILTFVPFGASLRGTFVCGGKNKQKAFTQFWTFQSLTFPPSRWAEGGQARAFAAAVLLLLAATAACSVAAQKMSKNSLNCPLLLLTAWWPTLFHWHLVPSPVNCCWRPASQDFLKIRFVLQRNQIFLGREILFPNLTNPFEAGDSESVAGMRLTGSLGFPDRRLRGTTRRKDWEPDWREAGLPTIRGLRAENFAVIKARTQAEMLLKFKGGGKITIGGRGRHCVGLSAMPGQAFEPEKFLAWLDGW